MKQLSMSLADPTIRARLMVLEQLAELTAVEWSAIRYTGKPGEIARIRTIRRTIEKNLVGLDKVINDPETTEQMKSLALALALMNRKQLCQVEVIEKAISQQLALWKDGK